jgi:hypothetical protein
LGGAVRNLPSSERDALMGATCLSDARDVQHLLPGGISACETKLPQ